MPSVPLQRGAAMAKPDRLQPGKPVAAAGAAEEDRELVADQLAATAGEDRRQAGQACPLLLADAGRRPSHTAAVWEHGTADRRAGSGEWVEKGDGQRRNYATREVRLGEVFVECAENTEFPGFGFLRQAETAPWGGNNSSQRGKPEPEGSKEGDWMYTGMVPGAKMEIPAKERRHNATHYAT